MSEMLGNVAQFFSSPAAKALSEIAGVGATGAGLVGNLLADRQRSQAAAAAKRNMDLTPAQLGLQVQQATQPLNAALVQAVERNVNANLAEQGLSEAPGLIASATSQGLAPYAQQNEQAALQLVMQRLGLPAEFARTIPQNAQLGPLIALLMKGMNIPGTPTATPSAFPTTGPTYDQAGITPGYDTTSPYDTQGSYNFGDLIPPSAY